MKRPTLPVVGAVGFAAGALTMGYHADNMERREAYPEGVVCYTPLPADYSLEDLADDSAFSLDADGVLRRSQFLDPRVFLRETSGKLDYSYAGDPFNVMPAVDSKADVEGDDYNYSFYGSDCEIVDRDRREVVSTFPSTEAARKILKATVAVSEIDQEGDGDNGKFRPWRCGAIAINPSTLLLPSEKTAWESFRCQQLGAGEAESTRLKITSDQQGDKWRFVHVEPKDNSALESIQIDDDYQPELGDVLVYSGYSRQGSREYFRTRVAGMDKSGGLLIETNVDQNTPYNEDYSGESHYRVMHKGAGGLFTPEGKLVAMTINAMERIEPADWMEDEQTDRVRAHNELVSDWAEKYDVILPSMYSEYQDHEQFVMAQRVWTDDVHQDIWLTQSSR